MDKQMEELQNKIIEIASPALSNYKVADEIIDLVLSEGRASRMKVQNILLTYLTEGLKSSAESRKLVADFIKSQS